MQRVTGLAAFMPLAIVAGWNSEVSSEPMSDTIAINVLIEPDANVDQIAQNANTRLRKAVPAGFVFDASHVPHLSVLHRYVKSSDLPAIYSAIDRVTAGLHPEKDPLTVTGYEASTWEEKTIVSLTVQRSPELERLQTAVVDALAPYSVERGDERAFVRTEESMQIDQSTIDYVASFVPTKVGANYSPHITLGFGDQATAKQMQSEPFTPVDFRPAGIAVYQLGNTGTARKKLHRSAGGQ
jgi:2'-5' RNA ligase